MSNEREQLIEKAEEVINEVFGDTSVLQSQIKEDLDGLIGYINTMIDTLN